MAKYFVPEQQDPSITTSKDGRYQFTHFFFTTLDNKDTQLKASVFGNQVARIKKLIGKEAEFDATFNERFDRYDVKFVRPEAGGAAANPSSSVPTATPTKGAATNQWSNGRYSAFTGAAVSTQKYCEVTATVFSSLFKSFSELLPKEMYDAVTDAAAKATAQYWILYQSGVVKDQE